MEVILEKDKETQNAIRFSDQEADHSKNIYLTKEEVEELGNPRTLRVTIEPA